LSIRPSCRRSVPGRENTHGASRCRCRRQLAFQHVELGEIGVAQQVTRHGAGEGGDVVKAVLVVVAGIDERLHQQHGGPGGRQSLQGKIRGRCVTREHHHRDAGQGGGARRAEQPVGDEVRDRSLEGLAGAEAAAEAPLHGLHAAVLDVERPGEGVHFKTAGVDRDEFVGQVPEAATDQPGAQGRLAGARHPGQQDAQISPDQAGGVNEQLAGVVLDQVVDDLADEAGAQLPGCRGGEAGGVVAADDVAVVLAPIDDEAGLHFAALAPGVAQQEVQVLMNFGCPALDLHRALPESHAGRCGRRRHWP